MLLPQVFPSLKYMNSFAAMVKKHNVCVMRAFIFLYLFQFTELHFYAVKVTAK